MRNQSIKSMTAFVQHRGQGEWGNAVWEIRTVNHRYFDQALRLPEELRELEPQLRELTRQHIQRGKIECTLKYKSQINQTSPLTIDQNLLKIITQLSQEVTSVAHDVLPLRLIDLLKWPGMINIQELEVTEIIPIIFSLYEEALHRLVEVREREGLALKEMIMTRLNAIENLVKKITAVQPTILKMQREQLQQRLAEIKIEYDPQRFEQEMVLLAQKSDVMEELDRLKTHVNEVQRITEQGGVVGRQLDFFMQELNRETNTMGSKTTNAELTQTVVELKILIEQMREQIQNIE